MPVLEISHCHTLSALWHSVHLRQMLHVHFPSNNLATTFRTTEYLKVIIINLWRGGGGGGGVKGTKVERPTSNNIQLTPNYITVGVQFWRFRTEQVMLESNIDYLSLSYGIHPHLLCLWSFRTVSKESQGGTLIFSAYVRSDLASTVHPKKYQKYEAPPKNI